MFCNKFKRFEKQPPNFSYLAYYEIKLFSKKNNRKQSLKISHTFYIDQR